MSEKVLQQDVHAGEKEHKHLALTKIVKINLNKDIDDDETIEYSPAYINTSYLTNGGPEHNMQFQITSIYVFLEIVYYKILITSHFMSFSFHFKEYL